MYRARRRTAAPRARVPLTRPAPGLRSARSCSGSAWRGAVRVGGTPLPVPRPERPDDASRTRPALAWVALIRTDPHAAGFDHSRVSRTPAQRAAQRTGRTATPEVSATSCGSRLPPTGPPVYPFLRLTARWSCDLFIRDRPETLSFFASL